MAKQTITTLRNWFKTLSKPTQQQFYDLFDSYFHKDDLLQISSISNLTTRLNEKANAQTLASFIAVINQRLNYAPILIDNQAEYVLEWTSDLKGIFGDYGDFRVWINGSKEDVPVLFELDENGKPQRYRFSLPFSDDPENPIKTLIFIK